MSLLGNASQQTGQVLVEVFGNFGYERVGNNRVEQVSTTQNNQFTITTASRSSTQSQFHLTNQITYTNTRIVRTSQSQVYGFTGDAHLLIEVNGVAIAGSQGAARGIHSTILQQLHTRSFFGIIESSVMSSQLLQTNIHHFFQTSSFQNGVYFSYAVNILRLDSIHGGQVGDGYLNEATVLLRYQSIRLGVPVLVFYQMVCILSALNLNFLLSDEYIFKDAELIKDAFVTRNFYQNVGQFNVLALTQTVNILVNN